MTTEEEILYLYNYLPADEKDRMIEISDRISKLFCLKFNINELDKLVSKGRLKEKEAQLIKNIVPFLDEVLPNRWDIQFRVSAIPIMHENIYGYNRYRFISGSYTTNETYFTYRTCKITKIFIVLHYPKATITNTKKYSLDIQDLFLRIPININSSKFETERVEGLRTTISEVEYRHNFQHSHLQGLNYRDHPEWICTYRKFCTGSGEINMVSNMYSLDNDIDYLKSLILMSENFIKWESEEGAPYMHINNLCDKRYVTEATINNAKTYANKIIKELILFGVVLDIDWKYSNNTLTIIDNIKFERYLKYAQRLYGSVFYHKDSTGDYFERCSPSFSTITNSFKQWIPFRNKMIYFKVTPSNNALVAEDLPKFLHPKIKNQIKLNLEYYANCIRLKKSCISRLSESINS